MSTKSTIAHGPNFHLYNEAFEQDCVYLTLDKTDFEATPDSITVAIPVVVWEVIRQSAGADLSWASKSDEEIRAFVEKEVDRRLSLNQTDTSNSAFVCLIGVQTFGPASDPRDSQIERGLACYFEIREKQLFLARQIAELVANQH